MRNYHNSSSILSALANATIAGAAGAGIYYVFSKNKDKIKSNPIVVKVTNFFKAKNTSAPQ